MAPAYEGVGKGLSDTAVRWDHIWLACETEQSTDKEREVRVCDTIAGHLRHCSLSSTAYFFTVNGDYHHLLSLVYRCEMLSYLQWRSLLETANLAFISGWQRNLRCVTEDGTFDVIAEGGMKITKSDIPDPPLPSR